MSISSLGDSVVEYEVDWLRDAGDELKEKKGGEGWKDDIVRTLGHERPGEDIEIVDGANVVLQGVLQGLTRRALKSRSLQKEVVVLSRRDGRVPEFPVATSRSMAHQVVHWENLHVERADVSAVTGFPEGKGILLGVCVRLLPQSSRA